jgi:hypothetical protein
MEGRRVTTGAAYDLVGKAVADAAFRKALAEAPVETLRTVGLAADPDAVRFAASLGGEHFVEAAKGGRRRSPLGSGEANTGGRRKRGTAKRKSPLRKGEANTSPSRSSGKKKPTVKKKPKSPLRKGEATAGAGRSRKPKSPLRKGEATAGPRRAPRRRKRSPVGTGEANT